jgi:hypothetical protein
MQQSQQPQKFEQKFEQNLERPEPQQRYHQQQYQQPRVSILEVSYTPPTRPYSQKELEFMLDEFRQRVRLSNKHVSHTKCGHCYLLRQNSRKEKEVETSATNVDVGNCSVCWKLHKTPRRLSDIAHDMVSWYEIDKIRKKLTYDLYDLHSVFYTWLYMEQPPQSNHSNHSNHGNSRSNDRDRRTSHQRRENTYDDVEI